jgi:uncharacterized protein YdeI (BOF family)
MENIMTSETTNNASASGPDATRPGLPPPPRRFRFSRHFVSAGIVFAVLALGAAGGAGANRYIQNSRPQSVLLLQPTPIAQMRNASPVAVKGQVAEVFGNKFIIQDDSGRALVDTGPRGEGGRLVEKGETITIQGRFENGFIRTNVMTRADGTSEAFGPPKQPHPKHGPGDRPGPRVDRDPGFERGPGREPPPPRPAL